MEVAYAPRLSLGQSPFYLKAVSSDGKWCALISRTNEILVVKSTSGDADAGATCRVGDTDDGKRHILFSPTDSDTILVADQSSLKVYRLTEEKTRIKEVGRFSLSDRGRIEIVERDGDDLNGSADMEASFMRARISVSPDGKKCCVYRIYDNEERNTLSFFSIDEEPRKLGPFQKPDSVLDKIAFSWDGRWAALLSTNGSVVLLNYRDGIFSRVGDRIDVSSQDAVESCRLSFAKTGALRVVCAVSVSSVPMLEIVDVDPQTQSVISRKLKRTHKAEKSLISAVSADASVIVTLTPDRKDVCIYTYNKEIEFQQRIKHTTAVAYFSAIPLPDISAIAISTEKATLHLLPMHAEWKPRTAALFDTRTRSTIFQLMQIKQTIEKKNTTLPNLPLEMWLEIIGMFVSSFSVSRTLSLE